MEPSEQPNNIDCAKQHDDVKKYLSVVFENSGFEYTYLCANDEIEVGDIVEAPSNSYCYKDSALVKQIKFLKTKQLPFDPQKLLKISKIVSKQDKDFIFDHIGFMQSKIDRTFLEDWTESDSSDWATWWKAPKGLREVCYEKDGVISCSYGDFSDENAETFFYCDITSPQNIEVKIDFVKTVLSMFFYKKIDRSTFEQYMERLGKAK